jgi:hypothetical protein
MDTICNLCKMKIEIPGPPVIGVHPRVHAAHLLQCALVHLGRNHKEEFEKLHHAASQYLSVLVLGCFDIGDEVLKQDTATARDFANRTLNATCEPATAPSSIERI